MSTEAGELHSHRFTGRWDKHDDTTSGLILMGARPYDPAIGRFLAVDPIDGGSLNNYDYAGQDPVNGYDLDGTMLEAVDGGPPPKIKRASGVSFDVGDDVYFGSKSDARSDWSNNPGLNSASRYFFRKATGKSTGFAARNLGNGRILLQYEWDCPTNGVSPVA